MQITSIFVIFIFPICHFFSSRVFFTRRTLTTTCRFEPVAAANCCANLQSINKRRRHALLSRIKSSYDVIINKITKLAAIRTRSLIFVCPLKTNSQSSRGFVKQIRPLATRSPQQRFLATRFTTRSRNSLARFALQTKPLLNHFPPFLPQHTFTFVCSNRMSCLWCYCDVTSSIKSDRQPPEWVLLL